MSGGVVDVIGIPEYIGADALSAHSEYGINETGWYTFVRVEAPTGVKVGSGFAVIGAKSKSAANGSTYVDIAVRFGAAPESTKVIIRWKTGTEETYLFRANDLAVRNLDSRVTYYVYDIGEYATWSYALADGTFAANTQYFTKDGNTYTLA